MKRSNIAVSALVLSLLAGCTPGAANGKADSVNTEDVAEAESVTDALIQEESQAADEVSSDAEASSDTEIASVEDTSQENETPESGSEAGSDSSEIPVSGSEASDIADLESRVLPSDEKLAALIEGKETLSFQYYMDKVFKDEEYLPYIDETIERIPVGKEYTLQELLNELYTIVHTEGNYYHYDEDHDLSTIQYANLDLGADGVPELLLYIPGPFVDSNGGITLIVKELDGKLQVIYGYADWSRSETSINEYGYISGGGSNGASNHGFDEGVLAADGTYTYAFYEEEESEINGYINSDNYNPEKDGVICMYTLRVGPYIGDDTPTYYTYRVFDYNSYDELDIPNLYTEGKYKELMDTVEGKTFITLDEFNALEAAREEEIGITEKIKKGTYPSYYPTGLSVSKDASGVSTGSEQDSSAFSTLNPDSIQFEINLVQKQSDEYDGLDYAAMDQQSTNMAIFQCYTLWDDELNSIWNRLVSEITPEEKEALLKEQRAWIKDKEAAMEDALEEAGGGTLGPQLQYGEGKVQTRKRVYYLAEKLAEVRGEKLEIPSDAK